MPAVLQQLLVGRYSENRVTVVLLTSWRKIHVRVTVGRCVAVKQLTTAHQRLCIRVGSFWKRTVEVLLTSSTKVLSPGGRQGEKVGGMVSFEC